MIKANELRIGNWIHHNNTFLRPEMNVDLFLINDNIAGDSFPEFDPIPLTPEILIACGFEKEKETNSAYLVKDGTGKDQWRMRIWLADYPRKCGKWFPNEFQTIEIDSLHQLQNLYFALTGEELNYKPLKL